MVFLSRKAVAAAAVIVLLAAAFSAGAWAVFMPAESTGLAVVIDPGHGGWDGGVTVALPEEFKGQVQLYLFFQSADGKRFSESKHFTVNL